MYVSRCGRLLSSPWLDNECACHKTLLALPAARTSAAEAAASAFVPLNGIEKYPIWYMADQIDALRLRVRENTVTGSNQARPFLMHTYIETKSVLGNICNGDDNWSSRMICSTKIDR